MRQRPSDVPKILPAGSVNRVLLVGGKNLTMFQSVGLIFIGICVAGGVGGLIFVTEFGSGGTGHSYAFYLIFFGCVMILWGTVMVANGILGIARRMRDSKQVGH